MIVPVNSPLDAVIFCLTIKLSAVDAVKGWKFTPARKNGVIVSQVIKVPITFSLKNR